MTEQDIVPVTLTAQEIRARRSRNLAIAIALAAMVALFFAMTIVRLGGAALDRN